MLTIMKCPTQDGLSLGMSGERGTRIDPMMCLSFYNVRAFADCFNKYESPITYNIWNLPFGVINARSKCICVKGHCLDWIFIESISSAAVIFIFTRLCEYLGIPLFILNLGGTRSSSDFFRLLCRYLKHVETRMIGLQKEGHHVINWTKRCTHWNSGEEQVRIQLLLVMILIYYLFFAHYLLCCLSFSDEVCCVKYNGN